MRKTGYAIQKSGKTMAQLLPGCTQPVSGVLVGGWHPFPCGSLQLPSGLSLGGKVREQH